jgi:hypothetical protein
MKKLFGSLVASVTLLALMPTFSIAGDPTPAASSSHTQYTCPMHPEVVQDKPGKCPKCGMKLVPKKAETSK